MNTRRLIDKLADMFGIDRCVSSMSGFQVLVELVIILALVLLFSLPAVMW